VISLPIILHGLSLTILGQSDRIMLAAIVGASETGIYSLIYNFSMLANVVIFSLEGVWVPWFTEKMKSREIEQINENVKLYIGIMTFVIISIILVSPEVLSILAPREYWYGQMIIPPIIISSYIIFIYTLYVNVEHFHKKTRHISVNTIIAAICNIILNLIFIPRYGMYAASITTLVSYSLSLYLHYRYSRYIEEKLFPIRVVLKYLFIVIFFGGIFYLISGFMIIRWMLLATISFLVVFKWKSKIIDFVRRK
jgi:O-antigen/teichoic acid export membrane protein